MSVRLHAGRVLQATPAGTRIVCISRIHTRPRRSWTITVGNGHVWRFDNTGFISQDEGAEA